MKKKFNLFLLVGERTSIKIGIERNVYSLGSSIEVSFSTGTNFKKLFDFVNESGRKS